MKLSAVAIAALLGCSISVISAGSAGTTGSSNTDASDAWWQASGTYGSGQWNPWSGGSPKQGWSGGSSSGWTKPSPPAWSGPASGGGGSGGDSSGSWGWGKPQAKLSRRKCPWWCPKNSHRDAWGCFCICNDGFVWNKSGQKCICDNCDKCMCEMGCPKGQKLQPGTCKCCPEGAVLDASCKRCICKFPMQWNEEATCCGLCSQGKVTLQMDGQCGCDCPMPFRSENPLMAENNNTCVCDPVACTPPMVQSPFTCQCVTKPGP